MKLLQSVVRQSWLGVKVGHFNSYFIKVITGRCMHDPITPRGGDLPARTLNAYMCYSMRAKATKVLSIWPMRFEIYD